MGIEYKSSFEVNVFPLKSMVMFPGSNLPLNIFEPRYKAMVKDCLDNNKMLALAPTELLGQPQNLCVGFGELKLLGKRKDGTMIVLLQGRGTARIDQILEKEPYMRAHVTEVNRDTDLSAHGNMGLSRIKIFLNSLIEGQLAHMMDDGFSEDIAEYQDSLSGTKAVDAAIDLLVPSLEQKQMILEMENLEGQVAMLDGLLQAGGITAQGQLRAQS